jgi:hypothetical protein
MNPTINPYDIIKSSYYQSSKFNKMEDIFNSNVKDQIDYIKNKDNYENIFSDNFLKEKNKMYEELKKKFETNSLNNIFYEHSRIIYIKITNLILLNILYNRIDNKYLLFSLKTECTHKFCLTSFIPEKVNDIIDKLSFDRNKLTKEKILEKILKGIRINDLNSLILSDKTNNESSYKIPFMEVGFKPVVNTPSPPLENTQSPPLENTQSPPLESVKIDNPSIISQRKTTQLKDMLGINNSDSIEEKEDISIYMLTPLFGEKHEIINKGIKKEIYDLRTDFFLWAIVQYGMTRNNKYLRHSSGWDKSAEKNALVGGKQYPEDRIDPEVYIFINDVASRVQKLDNDQVLQALNNLADKELDSFTQFIIKSLFKTINGKKPDSIIRSPVLNYKYNNRLDILKNFNAPDLANPPSNWLAFKRTCYSKNPIKFTFSFDIYNRDKTLYNKYLKYKNKYIELKSTKDKKIDYN